MATILVVDDRPTNRQLMVTLLGYRGHRVLEAGNGAEALERVRADHPDLVLTESRTRVVFYIAAYLATEARVLAQSCGVARVIDKPTDPEEVLRAVDECLSSGSESVLPCATLPEDGKDGHIRVLSNKLLEKPAELEVRNDELEATKLSLEKEMATRKHADEELRAANEKLSKSLSDLKRRNHEVALLSEMRQLLDSCLATEEAHAVVKQFGEKLHIGDSGCVYLLEPSRNRLEAKVSWGKCIRERLSPFPPENCWGLRRGRPHVVRGEAIGPVCSHMGPVGSAGYICVPLLAHGETIGVLSLKWSQHSQGQESGDVAAHENFVRAMGDTLALSLANLRMREHLQDKAIHDYLTHLYNRSFFDETLEREISRAIRNHAPLGLILLDIDHFKRINDSFGHPVGDNALRIIGSYLRSQVRREDVPCRYGGEEFGLILPGASLRCTQERAETLRHGLESIRLQLGADPLLFTVSLGVAAFPEHGKTRELIVLAADQALFRAKQGGRNRVAVAAVDAVPKSTQL